MNNVNRQKALLEKIVLEKTGALEKRTEELRTANKTKDKLFSIIGHDLKAPFNSILGTTELVISSIKDLSDEEISELMMNINSSSNQLLILLENLLSWANLQSEKITINKEKISLYSIFEEAKKLYAINALNKSITIHNDISSSATAFADRNMIQTIARNILSNAIKFTPIRGDINIAAQEKNGVIILSVSDNGLGMYREEIEYLMKNNRQIVSTEGTSQEKGTGLGLMLCKEFITRNNGRFWAESIKGEGSTFYFSLPLK